MMSETNISLIFFRLFFKARFLGQLEEKRNQMTSNIFTLVQVRSQKNDASETPEESREKILYLYPAPQPVE
jgi:myosin heavy subunit